MARKDSLLRPVTCGSLVGSRRSIDANLAAGSNPYLSVRDHTLPGLDSFFNDDQITMALPQGHRALLSTRVLLYDVHVGTLSRHLWRRRRNQDRIVNRVEHQPDIHKTAGPETMIRVGYRGAQINLPRLVL